MGGKASVLPYHERLVEEVCISVTMPARVQGATILRFADLDDVLNLHSEIIKFGCRFAHFNGLKEILLKLGIPKVNIKSVFNSFGVPRTSRVFDEDNPEYRTVEVLVDLIALYCGVLLFSTIEKNDVIALLFRAFQNSKSEEMDFNTLELLISSSYRGVCAVLQTSPPSICELRQSANKVFYRLVPSPHVAGVSEIALKELCLNELGVQRFFRNNLQSYRKFYKNTPPMKYTRIPLSLPPFPTAVDPALTKIRRQRDASFIAHATRASVHLNLLHTPGADGILPSTENAPLRNALNSFHPKDQLERGNSGHCDPYGSTDNYTEYHSTDVFPQKLNNTNMSVRRQRHESRVQQLIEDQGVVHVDFDLPAAEDPPWTANDNFGRNSLNNSASMSVVSRSNPGKKLRGVEAIKVFDEKPFDPLNILPESDSNEKKLMRKMSMKNNDKSDFLFDSGGGDMIKMHESKVKDKNSASPSSPRSRVYSLVDSDRTSNLFESRSFANVEQQHISTPSRFPSATKSCDLTTITFQNLFKKEDSSLSPNFPFQQPPDLNTSIRRDPSISGFSLIRSPSFISKSPTAHNQTGNRLSIALLAESANPISTSLPTHRASLLETAARTIGLFECEPSSATTATAIFESIKRESRAINAVVNALTADASQHIHNSADEKIGSIIKSEADLNTNILGNKQLLRRDNSTARRVSIIDTVQSKDVQNLKNNNFYENDFSPSMKSSIAIVNSKRPRRSSQFPSRISLGDSAHANDSESKMDIDDADFEGNDGSVGEKYDANMAVLGDKDLKNMALEPRAGLSTITLAPRTGFIQSNLRKDRKSRTSKIFGTLPPAQPGDDDLIVVDEKNVSKIELGHQSEAKLIRHPTDPNNLNDITASIESPVKNIASKNTFGHARKLTFILDNEENLNSKEANLINSLKKIDNNNNLDLEVPLSRGSNSNGGSVIFNEDTVEDQIIESNRQHTVPNSFSSSHPHLVQPELFLNPNIIDQADTYSKTNNNFRSPSVASNHTVSSQYKPMRSPSLRRLHKSNFTINGGGNPHDNERNSNANITIPLLHSPTAPLSLVDEISVMLHTLKPNELLDANYVSLRALHVRRQIKSRQNNNVSNDLSPVSIFNAYEKESTNNNQQSPSNFYRKSSMLLSPTAGVLSSLPLSPVSLGLVNTKPTLPSAALIGQTQPKSPTGKIDLNNLLKLPKKSSKNVKIGPTSIGFDLSPKTQISSYNPHQTITSVNNRIDENSSYLSNGNNSRAGIQGGLASPSNTVGSDIVRQQLLEDAINGSIVEFPPEPLSGEALRETTIEFARRRASRRHVQVLLRDAPVLQSKIAGLKTLEAMTVVDMHSIDPLLSDPIYDHIKTKRKLKSTLAKVLSHSKKTNVQKKKYNRDEHFSSHSSPVASASASPAATHFQSKNPSSPSGSPLASLHHKPTASGNNNNRAYDLDSDVSSTDGLPADAPIEPFARLRRLQRRLGKLHILSGRLWCVQPKKTVHFTRARWLSLSSAAAEARAASKRIGLSQEDHLDQKRGQGLGAAKRELIRNKMKAQSVGNVNVSSSHTSGGGGLKVVHGLSSALSSSSKKETAMTTIKNRVAVANMNGGAQGSSHTNSNGKARLTERECLLAAKNYKSLSVAGMGNFQAPGSNKSGLSALELVSAILGCVKPSSYSSINLNSASDPAHNYKNSSQRSQLSITLQQAQQQEKLSSAGPVQNQMLAMVGPKGKWRHLKKLFSGSLMSKLLENGLTLENYFKLLCPAAQSTDLEEMMEQIRTDNAIKSVVSVRKNLSNHNAIHPQLENDFKEMFRFIDADADGIITSEDIIDFILSPPLPDLSEIALQMSKQRNQSKLNQNKFEQEHKSNIIMPFSLSSPVPTIDELLHKKFLGVVYQEKFKKYRAHILQTEGFTAENLIELRFRDKLRREAEEEIKQAEKDIRFKSMLSSTVTVDDVRKLIKSYNNENLYYGAHRVKARALKRRRLSHVLQRAAKKILAADELGLLDDDNDEGVIEISHPSSLQTNSVPQSSDDVSYLFNTQNNNSNINVNSNLNNITSGAIFGSTIFDNRDAFSAAGSPTARHREVGLHLLPNNPPTAESQQSAINIWKSYNSYNNDNNAFAGGMGHMNNIKPNTNSGLNLVSLIKSRASCPISLLLSTANRDLAAITDSWLDRETFSLGSSNDALEVSSPVQMARPLSFKNRTTELDATPPRKWTTCIRGDHELPGHPLGYNLRDPLQQQNKGNVILNDYIKMQAEMKRTSIHNDVDDSTPSKGYSTTDSSDLIRNAIASDARLLSPIQRVATSGSRNFKLGEEPQSSSISNSHAGEGLYLVDEVTRAIVQADNSTVDQKLKTALKSLVPDLKVSAVHEDAKTSAIRNLDFYRRFVKNHGANQSFASLQMLMASNETPNVGISTNVAHRSQSFHYSTIGHTNEQFLGSNTAAVPSTGSVFINRPPTIVVSSAALSPFSISQNLASYNPQKHLPVVEPLSTLNKLSPHHEDGDLSVNNKNNLNNFSAFFTGKNPSHELISREDIDNYVSAASGTVLSPQLKEKCLVVSRSFLKAAMQGIGYSPFEALRKIYPRLIELIAVQLKIPTSNPNSIISHIYQAETPSTTQSPLKFMNLSSNDNSQTQQQSFITSNDESNAFIVSPDNASTNNAQSQTVSDNQFQESSTSDLNANFQSSPESSSQPIKQINNNGLSSINVNSNVNGGGIALNTSSSPTSQSASNGLLDALVDQLRHLTLKSKPLQCRSLPKNNNVLVSRPQPSNGVNSEHSDRFKKKFLVDDGNNLVSSPLTVSRLIHESLEHSNEVNQDVAKILIDNSPTLTPAVGSLSDAGRANHIYSRQSILKFHSHTNPYDYLSHIDTLKHPERKLEVAMVEVSSASATSSSSNPSSDEFDSFSGSSDGGAHTDAELVGSNANSNNPLNYLNAKKASKMKKKKTKIPHIEILSEGGSKLTEKNHLSSTSSVGVAEKILGDERKSWRSNVLHELDRELVKTMTSHAQRSLNNRMDEGESIHQQQERLASRVHLLKEEVVQVICVFCEKVLQEHDKRQQKIAKKGNLQSRLTIRQIRNEGIIGVGGIAHSNNQKMSAPDLGSGSTISSENQFSSNFSNDPTISGTPLDNFARINLRPRNLIVSSNLSNTKGSLHRVAGGPLPLSLDDLAFFPDQNSLVSKSNIYNDEGGSNHAGVSYLAEGAFSLPGTDVHDLKKASIDSITSQKLDLGGVNPFKVPHALLDAAKHACEEKNGNVISSLRPMCDSRLQCSCCGPRLFSKSIMNAFQTSVTSGAAWVDTVAEREKNSSAVMLVDPNLSNGSSLAPQFEFAVRTGWRELMTQAIISSRLARRSPWEAYLQCLMELEYRQKTLTKQQRKLLINIQLHQQQQKLKHQTLQQDHQKFYSPMKHLSNNNLSDTSDSNFNNSTSIATSGISGQKSIAQATSNVHHHLPLIGLSPSDAKLMIDFHADNSSSHNEQSSLSQKTHLYESRLKKFITSDITHRTLDFDDFLKLFTDDQYALSDSMPPPITKRKDHPLVSFFSSPIAVNLLSKDLPMSNNIIASGTSDSDGHNINNNVNNPHSVIKNLPTAKAFSLMLPKISNPKNNSNKKHPQPKIKNNTTTTDTGEKGVKISSNLSIFRGGEIQDQSFFVRGASVNQNSSERIAFSPTEPSSGGRNNDSSRNKHRKLVSFAK